MIRVFALKCDNVLTLSVSGHAGYAPKGQDIICASATTLAGTLAQVVKGKEAKVYSFNIMPGNILISCDQTDDLIEAFKVIMEGYEVIQHSNPDYLTILQNDFEESSSFS